MDVRDIMTPNPVTIGQESLLGSAIDVMVERKIRHLPVVDDQGVVVGVITDRDVRSAALTPALAEYVSEAAWRRLRGLGTTLESYRVKYAMTCTPVTTTPDVAVSQAAALMLEKHVGSLPVLEDGKLVGIITDRDAVRALATETPALARAPRARARVSRARGSR